MPESTLEVTPLSTSERTNAAWAALVLLATAELLGMSLWFTASAVSPELQRVWGLSAAQAGWLTTVVQLGFVAGTAVAALLNLADVVPARWYFPACALLAAASNWMLLATATFATALGLRFLTGFFLAGVYPPAMKMIATWFAPARAGAITRRGLAIGTIVGALTIGKALPYLLRAFEGLSYRDVIVSASLAAALAAGLVASTYRDGPHAFARRPFSWSLVRVVVHNRETRLALSGYLGHMWELYAMWTLIALFFRDHFVARGNNTPESIAYAGTAGFVVIAAGGVGSVLAGAWADRLGRERITIWAMAISGLCALVTGFLVDVPSALVLAIAILWGFSVVADSAQFSSIITEVAPAHAVGTALTLQTSLGFLLTAFSIWFALAVQTRHGWAVAFALLAIGPALGILAMARLRRLRAA
ncbi:MAG: MFS transporter [Longimicrobiales bacterium]